MSNEPAAADNATEQPTGPAAAEPVSMDPGWFIRAAEGEEGPVTAEVLRRLAVQGKITPATEVRRPDSSEWQAAEAVLEHIAPPAGGPRPPRQATATQQSSFFIDRHPWIGVLIAATLLITFFILAQCRGE